jgi:hypothetical protein
MEYSERFKNYMWGSAGYLISVFGSRFLKRQRERGYKLNPKFNFWKFEKEESKNG